MPRMRWARSRGSLRTRNRDAEHQRGGVPLLRATGLRTPGSLPGRVSGVAGRSSVALVQRSPRSRQKPARRTFRRADPADRTSSGVARRICSPDRPAHLENRIVPGPAVCRERLQPIVEDAPIRRIRRGLAARGNRTRRWPSAAPYPDRTFQSVTSRVSTGRNAPSSVVMS